MSNDSKKILQALGVAVIVKAAVVGSILYANKARRDITEAVTNSSQEKHGL